MTFPPSSAEGKATKQLIEDRDRLIAVAAYKRKHVGVFLADIADTGAASQLLVMLQQAARRSRPKDKRQRIARRTLKAFQHILDALSVYRLDMTVSPSWPIHVEKELVRRLKALSRTREQEFLAQFVRFAAEHSLGDDLIMALLMTAQASDEKYVAIEGDAVPIIYRIRDAPYGSVQIFESVSTDELSLLFEVVDATIERLAPDDPEARVRKRLREVIRNPTRRKWLTFKAFMFKEDGRAQTFALSAGTRSGIFRQGLPADWAQQISDNKNLILKFSKALLEEFKKTGEDGPGRPTNEALRTYASAVDDAYFGLTGEYLTLTRPTDLSAPDKRARTTGFGLEFMTAALQMVEAGLGPEQARTEIERRRSE